MSRKTTRNRSGGMRVWIERGYLIQGNVLEHAGREYHVPLEYQLFNEDGSPTSTSYRGTGYMNRTPLGLRLVIGDPYHDTNLPEFIVSSQPTTESNDYYSGFKAGLAAKRQAVSWKPTAKTYANSQRWWDGYNTAWMEKRA